MTTARVVSWRIDAEQRYLESENWALVRGQVYSLL